MESRQSIKCSLCDAIRQSAYHLPGHICRHLSNRCLCSSPSTDSIERDRDAPLVPGLIPRSSDRTALEKNQQIATESNDYWSNVTSKELTDLSLNQPEDHFPWNRLPKELQVKVLRYLTRTDLDKCRVLNREMFELIRRNERFMQQRRIIEKLQIRILNIAKNFRLRVSVRCYEAGIPYESFSPWGCNRLRKILKNATIRYLMIKNGRLTDNILRTISSCFLNVDCCVQILSIMRTSVAAVTSSVFLEFLRNAAPTHIHIRDISVMMGCPFSPEVLEFIVTRHQFELVRINHRKPEPFPLNDDILSKLTASTFNIDVTTQITDDGIKSFLGGLASGKHELVHGQIRTRFLCRSLLPYIPSNVEVFTNGCMLTLSYRKPI
ncbi:hypothetical protein V3C99_005467 [Haemonchus contortus]